MKNVLVTGSSTGIGHAIAIDLARAGHRVFATMRNPQRAPELGARAAAEKLPLTIHRLDVDSDASVAECFASLPGGPGAVDALVNNAGIERHGSTEELPLDDFRAIMETNYFGALRCIHQVIPAMRERRSGCIINVTSVAGKIASSPLGAYSASKHALEAVSEALAQEMRPFGVRVAVVQPGIIDTRMAHAIENPPPSRYQQVANLAALFRASLQHPTPPSAVAAVVRDIIEGNTNGQLRFPAGPDAAPFLAWRAGLSDEDWIEFNSLDAESYRTRVKQTFGLDVSFSS